MAWLILSVLGVVAVVTGLLLVRTRRSRKLWHQFGPEYGRVVAEEGDAGAAEAELHRRRKRHQRFEIRSLSTDSQQAYVRRWQAAQTRLVHQPATALDDVDQLIGEAMRDRGYPAEDFDQRVADISVDHPGVVENYRAAHQIALGARTQDTNASDVRAAMLHYRALFERVIELERGPATEAPS